MSLTNLKHTYTMLQPIHMLWKDMSPEQQSHQLAYEAEQVSLWDKQNEQYEVGDLDYFTH